MKMIETELICPYCEESFTQEHGNDVYCSDECEDLARKKRQKKDRDPVKELLLIIKRNHRAITAMVAAGIYEATREDFELYGVDLSLCRFIHLPGLEEGKIVQHFGEYNLITDNNFRKFKIVKHETKDQTL